MPKRTYAPRSTPRKRAKRATRRVLKRRRRNGRARPMRSLRTNYKAINLYRFVRETVPETVPFTLIPAGASHPVMGYLNFDDLKFNDMAGTTTDLAQLFARYHVDKIVTILTPLFQETVSVADNSYAPGVAVTAALTVTRINTKYLNAAFTPAANSDDQLDQLAQIQAKTVSNYATPRSMTITTYNPGVTKGSLVNTAGTIEDYRGKQPWMNIAGQSDIPFKHNAVIFAARTDGYALDTNWRYRVVHKMYFRCSQVA